MTISPSKAARKSLRIAVSEARRKCLVTAPTDASRKSLRISPPEVTLKSLVIAPTEASRKKRTLSSSTQKSLGISDSEAKRKSLVTAPTEAFRKSLKISHNEAAQKSLATAAIEGARKSLVISPTVATCKKTRISRNKLTQNCLVTAPTEAPRKYLVIPPTEAPRKCLVIPPTEAPRKSLIIPPTEAARKSFRVSYSEVTRKSLVIESTEAIRKIKGTATADASKKSLKIPPSEARQKNLVTALAYASRKSFGMSSNEATPKNLVIASNKESRKSLNISPSKRRSLKTAAAEESQESLKKSSTEAPQKSIKITPSKGPQKILEDNTTTAVMVSRKNGESNSDAVGLTQSEPSATRKSSEKSSRLDMPARKPRKSLGRRSRKKSTKMPSNKSKESLDSMKAVVLASERNLESKSKSVKLRQSRYCAICKKNFYSKQLLHEHNIEHHSFHHCPNCPKSYRRTRKFILHLRSHLEDHPYECKICLESFNQKRDLLAHKGVHRNSSNLGCDICPEVFPHLASLNRHRLAHCGPPYPCDLCDAIFSNVPDRTVHSKNHVHRCFMCPKAVVAFSSNVKLATHMYKVHRPEKYDPAENETRDTFQPCVSTGAVNLDDGGTDSMDEFCPSDDDSDTDVDNYQKDAVESVYILKRRDKFICFICYDLYPTSQLLMSHMTAHNWYPCNTCPQFFPNAEAFKKHKCDFSEVPIFRCKDCNFECENCILNRKIAGNGVNMSRLQSFAAKYPDLITYGITDYTDVAQRNLLFNFIRDIKSQEVPLDLESFNLIGAHNANLKIILRNPAVSCLFPRECVPELEDLYSKFQNISKIILNRVNCSTVK